jgi:hypothetical protein
MIQILYQGVNGSHQKRAHALAAVTAGSRFGDIDATRPAAIADLDTLVFWGHGEATRLCGKTPRELHDLIKLWKAQNPALNTIEIITCNARHASAGDPYVSRLKNGIGWRSSLRGIKIKALPTSVWGKNNAWSILLAETDYNSWVYITAPGTTDALLMEAFSMINLEQVPGRDGLRSFKGDIAERANEVVRANPAREWTMNYGYMHTLRAHLVVV